MSGLRVLYVGTLPPHPGGSAISCGQILAGLAARGHRVRAVAPITAETEAQGAAFARACPGVDLHRYPVPHFETGPRAPAADAYREAQARHVRRLLAALMDEARPDVLFAGRESFAWEAPDLAHARNVPVLQRLAGSTTTGLLDGSYPEPLASALRGQLRKADALVSPGRHLAAAARDRLGLGEVRVIPTGIDLARFRPGPGDPALLRRLAIPEDAVVAAHASNLRPLKRPLDVVRSAVEAAAADARLVYLVVGDGALRGAMEAACREARLARRFRFTGWQPQEETPRHLRVADLVLVPSEAEGLARVYLETQACGRVLVASDIPAAREVVVHGETGLLFPAGDVRALAAATLRAARDPALRERIGARARERVRTHSLDGVVAAYERLLAEVAERRGAGVHARDGVA